MFEDDGTGRTLARALRDAAARGVRVRLLLDDLYMGGHDPLFLGLAAHPNVEVRLFSPFMVRFESVKPPGATLAPRQDKAEGTRWTPPRTPSISTSA